MGRKGIISEVLDISSSLALKSKKLSVTGMVKVFIPALKRTIHILLLIKIKYVT